MNDFERVYYQLNIRLASPLSVGSGESESTDHDVFVDGNGNPIIPATSLAGVLRAYIGGDTAVALFGDLAKTESEKSKSSNIRVYDARCTKGGKDYITNRDFVKLENKVAVKGAKFDCQVVETGAEFVAYCELLDCAFEPVLESALAALNKGEILLGSKTTRGFGRVKISVKKRVFKNISTWLDFKMFNESEWTALQPLIFSDTGTDKAVIQIKLRSLGGLSIREYSTDIDMPDYKTLTLKSQSDFTPVIPGSTWAGAFRDRCSQVLSEDEIVSFFGDVNEKTKVAVKSQIRFSESILTGGTPKDITRNSIDRFSGATKSGALYTERTYYYGKTTLEITVPYNERLLSAVGLCLADLHNGFLTVGGLCSVGRGLFDLKEIKIGDKTLTEFITGETVDIVGFAKEAMNRDGN